MARRFAILAVGCLLLASPASGDNGHSLGQVQAKLDKGDAEWWDKQLGSGPKGPKGPKAA